MLNTIAGPDAKDSTCLNQSIPENWCLESCADSLENVTIGIPKEYHVEEIPEEILQTWQQGIDYLSDAGMCCHGGTFNKQGMMPI